MINENYGMNTYTDFNKAVLSFQSKINKCVSYDQVNNLEKMLSLAYLNFKPEHEYETILAAQKLEYLLNESAQIIIEENKNEA